MSVGDRVAAQEFEIETTKTPDEIRAACAEAAKAVRVFRIVKDSIEQGRAVYYVTSGRGTQSIAAIVVSWHESADGRNTVTLRIPEYRMTRYWIVFIPGPKVFVGISAVAAFSAGLRRELST